MLQYLTAPNLVLNSCEHLTRSRFISGDWQAIAVRCDAISSDRVERGADISLVAGVIAGAARDEWLGALVSSDSHV